MGLLVTYTRAALPGRDSVHQPPQEKNKNSLSHSHPKQRIASDQTVRHGLWWTGPGFGSSRCSGRAMLWLSLQIFFITRLVVAVTADGRSVWKLAHKYDACDYTGLRP